MRLAKKVFAAFNRDGYPVGIPLYRGARKPFGRAKLDERTIRALLRAKKDGANFCAWGSLTTYAEATRAGKAFAVAFSPLHAITSWNREQDQDAYDYIKGAYRRDSWIDNERDFRRIYLNWDKAKNRAWIKKIAQILPKNVRKIWLDAAEKTNTGKGTWKGGDVPSMHWALHHQDGAPMKYVTRRKKILDEFEEAVTTLFGEEKA
jgi:hypothetical protein